MLNFVSLPICFVALQSSLLEDSNGKEWTVLSSMTPMSSIGTALTLPLINAYTILNLHLLSSIIHINYFLFFKFFVALYFYFPFSCWSQICSFISIYFTFSSSSTSFILILSLCFPPSPPPPQIADRSTRKVIEAHIWRIAL